MRPSDSGVDFHQDQLFHLKHNQTIINERFSLLESCIKKMQEIAFRPEPRKQVIPKALCQAWNPPAYDEQEPLKQRIQVLEDYIDFSLKSQVPVNFQFTLPSLDGGQVIQSELFALVISSKIGDE